jgi:hypothetical protein
MTRKCPDCYRGTVTGPNGESLRCSNCKGTGHVANTAAARAQALQAFAFTADALREDRSADVFPDAHVTALTAALGDVASELRTNNSLDMRAALVHLGALVLLGIEDREAA